MYKVMIVDDEPIISKGLRKIIPWENYGCEIVAAAADGKSGAEVIRRVKPNILFTDIRMPNADGISMIAGLRSEFPDMEITVLTGYRNIEYAQAAIKLGIRRYLLKPSKLDEIKEAVEVMTAHLRAANIGSEADDGTMEPPLELSDLSDTGPGNFIVKNALRYMEAHYEERITLADLADQMYVSQWHLSKLLNKYTGQNFSDILNGIRIDHAKELLKDPRLKVHEVSEQAGFTDVTHFAKIFKKIVGATANEYRKNL